MVMDDFRMMKEFDKVGSIKSPYRLTPSFPALIGTPIWDRLRSECGYNIHGN